MLENLADDSASTSASYSSSIETARVYLKIIEELAYSVPDAGVPSIAPVLVEKMDFLLHKLVIMQTNFASSNENRNVTDGDQNGKLRSNFERGLAFWFSVLLRMVVIHRSAFLTSRPNSLQEQSRILISIFCIALSRFPNNLLRLFPTADYFPHPHPVQPEEHRPCPGILLQTHALDVAASLIDSFPDEARHHCARFLREKCPPLALFQNDSRFLYLLGPLPDYLPLASSSQPVSLPSPAASGVGSTPTPSGTFAGGTQPHATTAAATSPNPLSTGLAEGPNNISSRLCLQHRGRVVGPYQLRPWELLEDAAPLAGVNDTAVSLRYFDARRNRK